MISQLLSLATLFLAAQAAPTNNCTNIQLVIARGTDEPGVYGTYLGDPLYAATVAKFGKTATVSGYAVNYPASVACNSEAIGVNDTVSHVVSEAQKCPQQVFALVGYSQGADLMHNATIELNSNYPYINQKVVALTMFGDPGNRGPDLPSPLGGITYPFPPAYAYKLRENCNSNGDPVCSFSGTNITAHLTYATTGDYLTDSVNYIYEQYQSCGKVGPEPANYGNPGNDPATSPTPGNIAAIEELGELLGSTGPPCPS